MPKNLPSSLKNYQPKQSDFIDPAEDPGISGMAEADTKAERAVNSTEQYISGSGIGKTRLGGENNVNG